MKDNFSYLVSEGFRNLKINKLMTAASVGVLICCMLLIGGALLISININSIIGNVEAQNEVLVFLHDDASEKELKSLQEELETDPNISGSRYYSKKEALLQQQEALGEDGILLEGFTEEDNPIPAYYQISVKDLSHLDDTIDHLSGYSAIEKISAPTEIAKTITSVKKVTMYGGGGIVLLMTLVALIITANTIRISVFTRRREINIMKWVGATDQFIRMPFLVEGILLGIISAVIAFFILWAGYAGITHWLTRTDVSWMQIAYVNIVSFSSVARRLILIFLIGGMFIGGAGSMIFVRKYLKV